VWRYRQRQCKIPQDKIFASMGISTDGRQAPAADYRLRVEKLHTEFAKYFIETEMGLNVVSLCGLDCRRKLPSWVPDWAVDINAGSIRPLTRWYAPGSPKFPAAVQFKELEWPGNNAPAIHVVQGVLLV